METFRVLKDFDYDGVHYCAGGAINLNENELFFVRMVHEGCVDIPVPELFPAVYLDFQNKSSCRKNNEIHIQNDFSVQYQHPKWQAKRLEIMELYGWKCGSCGNGDRMLHVHHRRYVHGRKVWEYENSDLVCLCVFCHRESHGK